MANIKRSTKKFPTRAELLSPKKTVSEKKVKVKLAAEEAASLLKRINTVNQRIKKTEEVLNRHEKRRDMLLAELRPICKHEDTILEVPVKNLNLIYIESCRACGAQLDPPK